MSKKTRIAFQEWLISKGRNIGAAGADGIIGKETKQAVYNMFFELRAKAITDTELKQISNQLGDVSGTARIRAVAEIESAGSGWFNTGHVKILYERHKFWIYNDDSSAPKSTFFNYPDSGNYTTDANKNDINDSWEKLLRACEYDPMGAFMSVSMGKFQVMGFHYKDMGFENPWDMLLSLVANEVNHYNLLVKYVLINNLKGAFLKIDGKSENCVAFAKGYNGKGYAKYSYHSKIATAYSKYKAKGF